MREILWTLVPSLVGSAMALLPGEPAGDFDLPGDCELRIRQALARASAEGKRVALVFGADWCPDSRALSTALECPGIEPIVSRGFVVVKAGIGRWDRNLELGSRYGVPVRNGIPAVAILDGDGQVMVAQAQGEFRNARALTVAEIASFFARWSPDREASSR